MNLKRFIGALVLIFAWSAFGSEQPKEGDSPELSQKYEGDYKLTKSIKLPNDILAAMGKGGFPIISGCFKKRKITAGGKGALRRSAYSRGFLLKKEGQ